MFTRRSLLRTAAAGGVLAASTSLLPAWARSANAGNTGIFETRGNAFDLTIGHSAVKIAGRSGHAITINGTLPGPLIRFREGEKVTLKVNNTLDEDTSIHWHGLLVPFHMDGVPGVSFPGIKPKSTFTYEFAVPQSGTYWYHSHSGLQEQLGHYGPLIIDPAGADPVEADREYVLVLSDWTFEHPHKVFARLKKDAAVYNFQQRTVGDFLKDAREDGLGTALADRTSWGAMRMSPTDISDVTASVYTYLINGHATRDNWTAIFNSGERIRLRIINASAMTIFNFRIPGLPMTVVAADGLNVQPVETDEFQIGVAETYDVIVSPTRARPFALVAESIDRSGQVVATLAPEAGLVATAPLLREPPVLTHRDMGMDMASMDHGSMAGMDHSAMPGMDHGAMDMAVSVPQGHEHRMGAGVDNVAMVQVSRIDEPGLGLESVPHRALRYSQLRSLTPNPDTRAPGREIEIHLTGNMERYMWSFDGVKLSEVTGPIIFHEGERLRVTLVNDTMMTHPIHLHGMFFDLVVGDTDHKPRKHTVTVKPAERLSFDVTADHVGDWAFHCHLLFHMHAGMMQVVSVLPRSAAAGMDAPHRDHMTSSTLPTDEPPPKEAPMTGMSHEGHR
ncbi:copper-resistance protein, CopA family [Hyphomonas neptunium ATCC 15444]|uniref:Copper-resistance protein, CopA family n=2 Tax=Hyphomonas TaxID=85 RepID=Q0C1I0_HYPNA|nr:MULTISPECIES: copper resistance system multicopper oxidase [Hyphomonas]ABI77539.1 copper-resistance protein, CopA family [Hyphomonas neptunium ATCC 15444]KCZ92504.1 CopA family copper resistance protein [Hyphomonas hirschiana VP5]OZB17842.1 MAG: copper-binding protein [Hyphomonas sp. 34-62-18]